MNSKTWTCIAALALFSVLAIPVQLAAQIHDNQAKKGNGYIFVEVPTFGGPNFGANFSGAPNRLLNNRGTFVGEADTSITDPFCFDGNPNPTDCLVEHAFRWDDGALTDLPRLPGGANSQPFWINDRGLIAGLSQNGEIDPLLVSSPPPWGIQEMHAVVWKHNEVIDLGTLGGNSSLAQAMNNRGQVTGIALNATPDPISLFGLFVGTQMRAFLWENGAMQDLGTLGGPDAWGRFVNEGGQVAGSSFTDSAINPTTGLPTTHPFLWQDGKMTDLGSFGGTFGEPQGLNNRGHVVGEMNLSGDSTAHPFLWDGKSLLDLETFGGTYGIALAVNDAGKIIGGATNEQDQVFLAFLWSKGVMSDLGTLEGDDCSVAKGINSNGQIVGSSFSCASGTSEAVLWDHDSITDLNVFVPPSSGLQLTGDDIYINDRGEIAGNGVLPNGDIHAFLLIPCDERNSGSNCQRSSNGVAGAQGGTNHKPGIGLPENVRRMLRQRLGFGNHIPGLQSPGR